MNNANEQETSVRDDRNIAEIEISSAETDNANIEEEINDERSDRIVLADVSNKKLNEPKLSKSKMFATMADFYLCDADVKLLTFIKSRDLLMNKKAITRHWKQSGLAEMKDRSESLFNAMEKYKDWLAIQLSKIATKNKSNSAILKAIPEELEKFMFEVIKQLALCGQGIGKKAVSQILTTALKDWNRDNDKLFSTRTLDRFIENYDLECRAVKNIDPDRIAQVTESNRDAFYFRLDQIVALIHSLDPVNCPATKWDQVDSKNIDNMDEMGTDNTKFRDMMLIPKHVKQRIFQATPEGDRAKTHVSLCVFSKSNGRYKDDSMGIEGAPMPMIIHSKPSKKNNGADARESRMNLYTPDEFIDVPISYTDGISDHNPLGITIRTSNNGSMTKELFLDAMLHYVKGLSSDQGPSGKYVFLLLDSHVSRWNPVALYTLFKHRVVPVFFPSHLSIVVQPQDNGVILFLHKCIEEASLLERLFQTDTNISYVNRILESGFKLFRDAERRKLMDRGSNSTTRAYRVPGIVPCDPFSIGWRDNLELYASFNHLQINKTESPAPYFGVRPKEIDCCPSFSEKEIDLLDEAIPILAKNDDNLTLLDDPRTKCYAIANNIVDNWVEMPSDEREIRPRPTTEAEKIASKHMEITHIIRAEAKCEDTALLDRHFRKAKRQAILNLTLPLETIEAKPKTNETGTWLKVTKMKQPPNMWSANDGETTKLVSAEELDAEWIINLAFDMFSKDKKLKEKRARSDRRRRDEKDELLHNMAKIVAEEEREAKIKFEFDRFMNRPKNEQSFAAFKNNLVNIIEKPSSHTVTIEFEEEEHPIHVSAHGKGTSSMSQLVLENICKSLISASQSSEKKKGRRGNKVNRTKRGSDGIVKVAQIDEQYQQDVIAKGREEAKQIKKQITTCKLRLRELRKFTTAPKYERFWRNDGSLDLIRLTRQHLNQLLKVFNVEGRTKIGKGPKDSIVGILEAFKITKLSIEKLEGTLMDELHELGADNNFQVDQSFATADVSAASEDSFEASLQRSLEACEINIATDCENSIGGISSEDLSDDDANKTITFMDLPEIFEIPVNESSTTKQRRSRRRQNRASSSHTHSPSQLAPVIISRKETEQSTTETVEQVPPWKRDRVGADSAQADSDNEALVKPFVIRNFPIFTCIYYE
eukprot:CAMPEP_0116121844 /NCGR_PEP_ID=MMETSP0329-20121206/3908_1 /TAXON_ID=697910 /ORGANISM="Pseudo-nitzschia arenysensis, Strain B593" /LENGTH=1159 /DNA_ID=CAMNT_0003615673 /DNA_START=16 /DNA_END=3493 /DNA_ORIENTATION=-